MNDFSSDRLPKGTPPLDPGLVYSRSGSEASHGSDVHHRRVVGVLAVAAAAVLGIGALGVNAIGDGDAASSGSPVAAIATGQTNGAETNGAETNGASTNGASDGSDTAEATGVETALLAGAAGGVSADVDPAGPVEGGVGDLGDLDGVDLSDGEECLMEVDRLRMGDSGRSVSCLQQALRDAGAYSGSVTGQFDTATFNAVSKIQTERALFVDGVVGRETALSLGVWPDEESFVVRTPPPPAGAMDLLGYRLSSVATSGPDAPALPENSGTGKRVVYDRKGQRVWAVDKDERVIRSWLVSGSMYNNEIPGTHYVYSRSEVSTAWNGAAKLPRMIRWLKTERGHIGFHGIPTKVSDGSVYQTDAELGTRLSGGCQRQNNLDAAFLWDFATEGTKVVVL